MSNFNSLRYDAEEKNPNRSKLEEVQSKIEDSHLTDVSKKLNNTSETSTSNSTNNSINGNVNNKIVIKSSNEDSGINKKNTENSNLINETQNQAKFNLSNERKYTNSIIEGKCNTYFYDDRKKEEYIDYGVRKKLNDDYIIKRINNRNSNGNEVNRSNGYKNNKTYEDNRKDFICKKYEDDRKNFNSNKNEDDRNNFSSNKNEDEKINFLSKKYEDDRNNFFSKKYEDDKINFFSNKTYEEDKKNFNSNKNEDFRNNSVIRNDSMCNKDGNYNSNTSSNKNSNEKNVINRNTDNESNKSLNEAAEAILLLSNQINSDTAQQQQIYCILRGANWEYYIRKTEFYIEEDNICTKFNYNKAEKQWKATTISGKVCINGKLITNSTKIEDGSLLDFGIFTFRFYYPLKQKKMQKSYQKLIIDAIRSNKESKLTLSQIYEYFIAKCGFSEEDSSTWKNSIRHNLSLSKIFKKVPRTGKHQQGKGMFWTIDEDALLNKLMKKKDFVKDVGSWNLVDSSSVHANKSLSLVNNDILVIPKHIKSRSNDPSLYNKKIYPNHFKEPDYLYTNNGFNLFNKSLSDSFKYSKESSFDYKNINLSDTFNKKNSLDYKNINFSDNSYKDNLRLSKENSLDYKNTILPDNSYKDNLRLSKENSLDHKNTILPDNSYRENSLDYKNKNFSDNSYKDNLRLSKENSLDYKNTILPDNSYRENSLDYKNKKFPDNSYKDNLRLSKENSLDHKNTILPDNSYRENSLDYKNVNLFNNKSYKDSLIHSRKNSFEHKSVDRTNFLSKFYRDNSNEVSKRHANYKYSKNNNSEHIKNTTITNDLHKDDKYIFTNENCKEKNTYFREKNFISSNILDNNCKSLKYSKFMKNDSYEDNEKIKNYNYNNDSLLYSRRALDVNNKFVDNNINATDLHKNHDKYKKYTKNTLYSESMPYHSNYNENFKPKKYNLQQYDNIDTLDHEKDQYEKFHIDKIIEKKTHINNLSSSLIKHNKYNTFTLQNKYGYIEKDNYQHNNNIYDSADTSKSYYNRSSEKNDNHRYVPKNSEIGANNKFSYTNVAEKLQSDLKNDYTYNKNYIYDTKENDNNYLISNTNKNNNKLYFNEKQLSKQDFSSEKVYCDLDYTPSSSKYITNHYNSKNECTKMYDNRNSSNSSYSEKIKFDDNMKQDNYQGNFRNLDSTKFDVYENEKIRLELSSGNIHNKYKTQDGSEYDVSSKNEKERSGYVGQSEIEKQNKYKNLSDNSSPRNLEIKTVNKQAYSSEKNYSSPLNESTNKFDTNYNSINMKKIKNDIQHLQDNTNIQNVDKLHPLSKNNEQMQKETYTRYEKLSQNRKSNNKKNFNSDSLEKKTSELYTEKISNNTKIQTDHELRVIESNDFYDNKNDNLFKLIDRTTKEDNLISRAFICTDNTDLNNFYFKHRFMESCQKNNQSIGNLHSKNRKFSIDLNENNDKSKETLSNEQYFKEDNTRINFLNSNNKDIENSKNQDNGKNLEVEQRVIEKNKNADQYTNNTKCPVRTNVSSVGTIKSQTNEHKYKSCDKKIIFNDLNDIENYQNHSGNFQNYENGNLHNFAHKKVAQTNISDLDNTYNSKNIDRSVEIKNNTQRQIDAYDKNTNRKESEENHSNVINNTTEFYDYKFDTKSECRPNNEDLPFKEHKSINENLLENENTYFQEKNNTPTNQTSSDKNNCKHKLNTIDINFSTINNNTSTDNNRNEHQNTQKRVKLLSQRPFKKNTNTNQLKNDQKNTDTTCTINFKSTTYSKKRKIVDIDLSDRKKIKIADANINNQESEAKNQCEDKISSELDQHSCNIQKQPVSNNRNDKRSRSDSIDDISDDVNCLSMFNFK
ncbi:hypothetical protein EDEG_03327 [Edhazardia aedis USNM 41457]|uniref:Fork-head domain-containing protein n=1 Tax=Edhazardia aedis (strain USNM 41457) TaxID=1003232 RepID=J8ZRC0_EDHAE|nr:hypothetical protein EDEG_03327 [Edhazardia aedis USNM 41457]|eukprot:EJW02243.1 hypothetical protein EDEG_03327 [Edhazardia aedis USNM 41457]